VLAACRALGIGRLVYTSTPSVTHRRTHPVEGGTADTVPYGEGFKAPYAATKTIAEKEVLAANGSELADGARLATVALRPRLIWGPGDQQILPRLVERAKAGRLRFVGDGRNRIDTTYIDNAAQAHFDAFEHLAPGAACAGRAYFISNGEPRPTREIVNALLEAAGAPRAGIPSALPRAAAAGAPPRRAPAPRGARGGAAPGGGRGARGPTAGPTGPPGGGEPTPRRPRGAPPRPVSRRIRVIGQNTP